jgi:hypothetical protein
VYVLDFVDYFEDTFIGRVIRNNRRRAPRFSVNMWNCFSRLDEELPRTNNSSEGWNRAIKVGSIILLFYIIDRKFLFRIQLVKILQYMNQ